MNRKFDILVPMYKEEESVVKVLLDSISIQQNVNFDEIGVIICSDAGNSLSEQLISSYPFVIEMYNRKEHKGVSYTRNECLDKSKADYVMFCDADDLFYNACGLWIIFNEINGTGFDSLISVFIEETRDANKNPIYVNHQMDSTFVHGKIHRRKFLIDSNIRWNDNLVIHEDSYFNCLCQKLATELKYCPTPFYLWKWRDNSVCRHDKLYLNKTYVNMLESNTALVKQFMMRGKRKEAQFYATSMIFDTYYSLNCDRWWTEEGNAYLQKTELRFKEYWNEFKELFDEIEQIDKSQIIMGIKNRFFNEGLLLERITFNDWIKHIENLED